MKLFNITKESNKYISDTLWNPLPTFPVFGGQIVAQALCAAYKTVAPTSEIHSLHCYFLSPAKVSDNIEYKVDTNKNGNLLENRNVIAMQHNTIFTMTASFTKPYRKGHNYQQKKLMNDKYVPFNDVIKAIEPKLLDHLSFLDEYMSIYKGEKSYKYELKQKLNEKDMSCFIAFISDMFLLESALHVMDENFFSKNVRKIASIDHTLYFHASCSDTVLYFVPECVSIKEGKAYCIGYIFDSKGMHIATACQEGLIRLNNE